MVNKPLLGEKHYFNNMLQSKYDVIEKQCRYDIVLSNVVDKWPTKSATYESILHEMAMYRLLGLDPVLVDAKTSKITTAEELVDTYWHDARSFFSGEDPRSLGHIREEIIAGVEIVMQRYLNTL